MADDLIAPDLNHLHNTPLPPKADTLEAILRDMKACLERAERFSRDLRQRMDELKRNVGGM